MASRNFTLIVFLFIALGLSILLFIYQTRTEPAETAEATTYDIFPVTLTMVGYQPFKELVPANSINVSFTVNEAGTSVQIQENERYFLDHTESFLLGYLEMMGSEMLGRDGYFHHPGLNDTHLQIAKSTPDTLQISTVSSYRRQDIEVFYQAITDDDAAVYFSLHSYLRALADSLLQDSVDPDTMLVVRSMHEALRNPERVYTLNLRNSRSRSLAGIGQLTNLRHLNISGSFITELPDEIKHCKQLVNITANASRLKQITPAIGELSKLRYINMGYCRLRSVPREMAQIKGLWTLSLGGNQLKELPAEFAQLKNLRFASMDDNQFKTFPTAVLGFSSVDNLWLHDNDFTNIPAEITQLRKLQRFFLDTQDIPNIESVRSSMPWVRFINPDNKIPWEVRLKQLPLREL